jgi:DNA-binding Xre family transcriptional regulator
MTDPYGISYNKLWKLLIDKKIKKMKLLKMANISSSTMAKMARDEFVSLEVLIRIIKVLGCSFDDIMEVVTKDSK